MKISFHVPKGTRDVRKFIRKEIEQSQNIKSKKTRKDVESGLRKILNVYSESGFSFYTNGWNITIEPYYGIHKIYRCGKEYIKPKIKIIPPTMLIVIDANEACIGEIENEHINVLWRKQSLVPRKHRKGGQSKERFSRGREQVLKNWLRKVSEKTERLFEHKNIIVGGPGMTKKSFINELPS